MLNPKISVVVPVRNSERHVRSLVESLMRQTLPPSEIILVGSKADTTWQAIQDYIEQGLVRPLEVSTLSNWGGRDSNYKRMLGCSVATGEVIALTDSKIVLPPDWLETGLSFMSGYEVEAVAGIMKSAPHQDKTFMVNILDKGLICENPRFGSARLLSRESFGQKDSLPVTANLFLTRRVFDLIQANFPIGFTVSYEDFSLAWVIVIGD